MKRILALILTITLLVLLPGCGATKAKNKIFRFVEKNYDAIVTACERQDTQALLAIDGVKEVKLAEGYVIVYCHGAGIVPSSQYYGFYYSEENSPVTVDCNLDIVGHETDLSPEGDGYECVVHGNVYYTEHIKGSIYFYSAAY